jgi:hypothetical protein
MSRVQLRDIFRLMIGATIAEIVIIEFAERADAQVSALSASLALG